MNSQVDVTFAGETLAAPKVRAADLLALAKPRITFMVVLTGMSGMALASALGAESANASWGRSTMVLLALSLVVAAANALNMLLERDIDAKMPRTKDRPLAAGRMAPMVALVFGAVTAVVGVSLMLTAGGPVAATLAAAALFLYVSVYTPLKRKSPWALHVGAVPGALPPLIGWTAATGGFEAPGLALFGLMFFWQLPHFVAIAVFQSDAYARAGIRVLPSEWGMASARRHARWTSLGLWAASLALVPAGITGWLYPVIASVLGAGMLALALAPMRSDDVEGRTQWARRLFFGSLVYVPAIVVAMLVAAVG